MEDEAASKKRKWITAGIIVGVLVGAAVIAIIIVFTTTGGDEELKGFDLQQAFNEEFQPLTFNGAFGKNGEIIYTNKRLVSFDKYSNKIRIQDVLLTYREISLDTIRQLTSQT